MAGEDSSRALRFAGIGAILLFLGLVARFWHPVYGFTAFFQLDESNDRVELQAFHTLPVYVYHDTGGYDGLYYAQLAIDPMLKDPHLPGAMDNASYRARRILPSALAWVLGGGKPAGAIAAYSLLNVIAWLALAALLWRVLDVNDARSWVGWAGVLFSAGALCSVRLALTDLTAATLVTAALLAAETERKRTALVTLASAALARETSLLGVAGLVKRPWVSFKNVARVALALVPLLLWMAYVRSRVGPADQGLSNFTWPVLGWIEKLQACITAVRQLDDPVLAWTTLLATVGLSAQGIYILARPDLGSRWWRVGAVYTVLLLCLGTAVWEGFPGAATRVLLPLTIAFNVLVRRARAGIAWLAIGNLGVLAGLLTLQHVPSDPHELTSVRRGNVACIARVGEGWYDHERTLRHDWFWARQAGTVELQAWPETKARLRLQFGLRALAPRAVVLRENGREIWRTTAGTVREDHAVDVEVPGGNAILSFSTDDPPVRERAGANPRELGFALYDFRVDVPKR